jgi:anaerobic selenocysteine-containing dehydrogenase
MELDVSGREVRSVRGDEADAFSEGYLCPKGVALKDLDSDPDRLRTPMVRSRGTWNAISWDEAFREVDRGLNQIISQHGRDALALYLGNPVVHNTALTLYVPVLRAAMGTRNVFTASSVDQLPKQLVVGLLFGNGLSVPIPDVDRCRYLLILGANPLVSNGSLMTAPNIGERLKRLRSRGGKVVVIDPCRTRTAEAADEHHFIQPGTDACFLFAIVHTLFTEELASPGRLAQHTSGLEQIRSLAEPFTPEVVAARCGIEAEVIRGIARELAKTQGAAVYGRLGTCTQEFGTLASWLPEVIHVLTGNLDREGGAMFTMAAHGPANTKGEPGSGRGLRAARWKSRVRELPETFGELPVTCLGEEIETPGDGQIRGLVTVAGNPVVSTPNGGRLDRAFESLEFMVSLDI